MAIPTRDARWKTAGGNDPVAKQLREKLSEMSRDLNRFGDVAAHAEKKTPEESKQWEKAVEALKKAEAAIDAARYALYPLG
jgi:ferritin-like protein